MSVDRLDSGYNKTDIFNNVVMFSLLRNIAIVVASVTFAYGRAAADVDGVVAPENDSIIIAVYTIYEFLTTIRKVCTL